MLHTTGLSKDGTALSSQISASRVPSCRRTYANLKTSSNNVQGTLRWMAIEQFSDTTPGAREQYSFATDIWSFGMTIYVRPARFLQTSPQLRQAPDLIYVRAYVLTNPQEVLTGNIPFEHLRLEPLVMRAIMDLQVTSSAGRAFARSRRGGAVVGVMSVMLACRPEVQADDHGSSRATARRMCLGASRGLLTRSPRTRSTHGCPYSAAAASWALHRPRRP